MWGYAARRDAPSVAVRDRLLARALVLEADSKRMAIVALDLGRAPTRTSMATIREKIKADSKIDVVFLVASHTHHGPVIEVDTWPAKKSYVRELEEKLIEVIAKATKSLQPAKIGFGKAESSLNTNRHDRSPEAPVDRELLVMRLEDTKGTPIAHAINYAAHPTILPAKEHTFSPDYPGFLCEILEKETKAPCLFLQGAAGDLSPSSKPGRTPEKFAEALAKEVRDVIGKIRCSALEAPNLRHQQDEFRFEARLDVRNPLVKMSLSAAFFPALVAHFEREYAAGVRPSLTTAVLDKRIGFVGVSGEVFCAHAIHLKRRAKLDHLFFLGYCNDYHQYFPTIEAAAQGGYGTEIWIASAAIGSGEKMMDQALTRLWQMRGKLR